MAIPIISAMGRDNVPMSPVRAFGASERGQSLIEIALALPLVLITLLGSVDVGRAYVYSTAVTSAAREAAHYAAKTSGATLANVALRACNETGFNDYNAAVTVSGSTATCASGATVTSTACSTGGTGDVIVEVAYQFDLVSGYLFQRLIGRDNLTARGSACYRSLQ
jgi:Flp pilus assembly protein TadG